MNHQILQKSILTEDVEIPFGAKDSELQEVTYYIPKDFHAQIVGNKVIIKKDNEDLLSSEQHSR